MASFRRVGFSRKPKEDFSFYLMASSQIKPTRTIANPASHRAVPAQDAVIDGDRVSLTVESPKLKGFVIRFSGQAKPKKLTGDGKLALDAVGKSFSFPYVASGSAATTYNFNPTS